MQMNLQRRLINEARMSGLLLPGAALFGFLTGGLGVLQAFQTSRIITGVFLDHQTLSQLLSIIRLILVIVLARGIFAVLNEIIAGRLAVDIKTRLRRLLLEKIKRLGPSYLKSEQTGELATAALQGVEALDAYYSQFLPQILIAVMLPLTILIVTFPMDLLSGIVFLLTAPLIPLFMMLIGWASEAATRHQWLARTRLGTYFLDTLQGIAELKALGRSRERTKEVREVGEQYRTATLNVLRVTFLSALVLELVATISTAVVAVEIGLRLLNSQIEFQQAFFILLIAPEFYIPMRNLSARYHAGMSGVTAARRIFEVLGTPEPAAHVLRNHRELADHFASDFSIFIRNVNFAYKGQTDNLLDSISLEIHRGRHYALAGMSGAGKSTLAQIILRLIEPDSGKIEINGIDIAEWAKEDWRRFIGWVPQRPKLFNRSLLENITLGNKSFSLDEINKAIEAASLKELVDSMPQGLYTQIEEAGARLSGGEAQRVAIARVFLRNPMVLLMDEPAAHLDLALERRLNESIKKLMNGRTTLIIAHRLSTLKTADEIFLLDKGRLADCGSDRDLIQRCEVYRSLRSVGKRIS